MSDAKQLVTRVIQPWFESERGWGVRPDGYSVHENLEAKDQFVHSFMTEQQRRLGDRVPDIYTKPGTPYLFDVEADVALDKILGGKAPEQAKPLDS